MLPRIIFQYESGAPRIDCVSAYPDHFLNVPKLVPIPADATHYTSFATDAFLKVDKEKLFRHINGQWVELEGRIKLHIIESKPAQIKQMKVPEQDIRVNTPRGLGRFMGFEQYTGRIAVDLDINNSIYRPHFFYCEEVHELDDFEYLAMLGKCLTPDSIAES